MGEPRARAGPAWAVKEGSLEEGASELKLKAGAEAIPVQMELEMCATDFVSSNRSRPRGRKDID